MATTRSPRRGSLQFWPRVRACRQYPKVRTWSTSETVQFLGFAGYKAGMTHVFLHDTNPNSMTKDEEVFVPATVIECPPLKIHSLKFYKKTPYGNRVYFESIIKSDKNLARKLTVQKKKTDDKVDTKLSQSDDIRVIVYTQPGVTGIGKKKPELFELGVGGSTVQEKYDYIRQFFTKDITINDIFKEGQQIDMKAVTKGKGFQGTTKRFGSAVRTRKTEKAKRGIGTLGPWHPAHILFTVAQPGKMGYHTRTEPNKVILKIGDKPTEINPKGGFLHYGLVKNPYIILKGSVAGPVKRLIRFTPAMQPSKRLKMDTPELTYISQESKQKHR